MAKLDELLDIEGYDYEDFCEVMALESVVPGICMNDGCDYTTQVEPDCTEGYCEFCCTQTVRSGVDLAIFNLV